MKRGPSFREICVSLLVLTLYALSPRPAASCEAPTALGPAQAELADAIANALSGWLPGQLQDRSVPGAAAAVVNNDTIVWQGEYGVTNGPGSPAITVDTIFCIRSISKSVTSLGVLMAVQEGLIDLDTPISEYLPDFTVHSRYDEHPEDVMTLRHMLSHWAGFTHDPPAGLNLDQPDYFERYIETISDTWLRFPVGYRMQYANRGVDLAGYIIQIRSGQPFAEYLREKVLLPLGMNNSSFDLGAVGRSRDRAIGHDTKGREVPVPLPEIPAAGLYSSIRDMSKYLQFHLNGGMVNGRRVLRQDLLEQFHSIQFAHHGQRTGYTLGLWREVVSNTYSLYHSGGGRGFGSHLIIYPDLGVGVMVLTNREYHGLTEIEGRQIVNGPIINRYGPLPTADPELEKMQKLNIQDPRVKSILGRYGDSPGVVVGIENGVLGLRLNDTTFSAMTIYDDGGELVGFYGSTREVRLLPSRGKQPGSMMLVSRTHSNSNSHYLDFNDSPLDPPGPAKSEWQNYVGEYDVIWEDEPDSTVTISLKNGYLYYRDGKCDEQEPGLFFLYDGEAIDFRSIPATYATQEIRKKSN
jgi:CubicO group peptidase (beta-lactamase class C family)